MSGYSVEAILKATGADKFASDFEKAGKSLSGLTGSTKKATGGVKSFMGGVGKLAGAIGITKLVSAGFSAIRSSVDGAVSRVDTLNKFPKVLQQMGASGEDADRSIARLSDGIQGLPTTLDGVAGTAQRMFTILGDIDLATESTLALNNAFLASGASQADASRGLEQYTQMLSAGKVDMQSWRTLQETMPYALKETAEAFGFTGQSATNDFYAALQSGEVTMDEMNAKIIELSTETGGFAETALTASEGIGTSWTNIQTAITTGIANVIQAINEWMEDAGLGSISDQFDKVKEAVQGAFSFVVEQIPVVLDAIGNLYNFITESTAFQVFKEVVVTAFDAIVEGVQLVIDWVQQLSESSSENFTRIYEVIQEAMTLVWEVIQTVWTAITEFWEEHGEQILTNITDVFTSIWETVELYLGYVLDIWESVLGIIVPFVQEQLAKVEQYWDENGEMIMAAIDVIADAVQKGFEFIQSVIEFVMPIVQGIIENAWGIITTIFGTAIDIVLGLVDVFASLLTGDFEGAKEAVTGIWESLWEGIKGVVSGAWNLLSGAFSSLWNGIKGWFTGLVDDALGWGKNMIGGFIDGIKSMGKAVGDAASGIASTVGGWLGFSSPADKGEGRFIEDWGANMIDGFLDGALSKKREVGKVMNDIVGAVNPKNLDNANFSVVGSLGGQVTQQVNHSINNGTSGRSINVTQYITSPNALNEREMQRRSRLELQKLGVDFAY